MRGSVIGLVIATLVVSAPAASAQETAHPFGLTFGMSLTQLKKLVPDLTSAESRFMYVGTSVPTPFPGFEAYGFFVVPTNGLCKVVALRAAIEDDPHGTKTRSEFGALQEALSRKYGEPSLADSLVAETAFEDSQYWSMTLSDNSRVYSADWPNGDGPLGFGLNSITLEAKGVGFNSNRLVLTYRGENIEECRKQVTDAL